MWTVAASACLAIAVVVGVAAALYQVGETRPRGEGELFQAEGDVAAAMVSGSGSEAGSLDMTVRHIRNHLEIEAVGVIDDTGTFLASTSPNWEGSTLDPPLLSSMAADGRFGAATVRLSDPVSIDGVTEWEAGDALYQVVQPLDDGGALVLSYDVSGLLERRAAQAGVRTLTLVMAGAGSVMALAGTLLLVGRAGARRRVAQAAREAEQMQVYNRALELSNEELREAREQAEKALALAEETNRIRSEFVLMINHELRTPLTAVVTGAELLDEGSLGDFDREQVLGDMVRDARRLQELIAQMLTVARIENRGLGYSLREVSLGEVMERIGHLRGERVSWDEYESWRRLSRDTLLRTDPDPLCHLVLSLADNAITHGASHVRLETTHHLPFHPEMHVGELPDDAVFLLLVDDGPGIDPTFLPRVFEKFEKQGRSSGTGLGLYLARLMVEAIDGAIVVRSGPEGTTMGVAVPTVPSRSMEAVAS